MAYYNNGYPGNYQQIYQPQYPQQNQNNQNGLIWVQGEAAAKAYLVAPGCTVQLWDSEEKIIYLKSADASGMPSMKILEYTIRGDDGQKASVAYATKEDLDALAEKVKELSKRRRIVKEVDEDE